MISRAGPASPELGSAARCWPRRGARGAEMSPACQMERVLHSHVWLIGARKVSAFYNCLAWPQRAGCGLGPPPRPVPFQGRTKCRQACAVGSARARARVCWALLVRRLIQSAANPSTCSLDKANFTRLKRMNDLAHYVLYRFAVAYSTCLELHFSSTSGATVD